MSGVGRAAVSGDVMTSFAYPCGTCGRTVHVADTREQPHDCDPSGASLIQAWWNGHDHATNPNLPAAAGYDAPVLSAPQPPAHSGGEPKTTRGARARADAVEQIEGRARGLAQERAAAAQARAEAAEAKVERVRQIAENDRLGLSPYGVDRDQIFAVLAGDTARHGGAVRRAERFIAATTQEEKIAVLTEGLPAARPLPEPPSVCACGHDRERHGVEAGCIECRCASISGVIHGPVRPLPEPEQP